MFSAYFDASGGSEHRFVVVAGYISRIWKWMQFENVWLRVLDSYGVPYFHMKEFAHSKGPYETWKGDEGRRASFLQDLVRVIADNVERSVACMVNYDNFEKVDQEFALKDKLPFPYVLAARDCIARANDFLRSRENADSFSVEYIFEKGDKGQGALVDRCSEAGLPVPTFKPSRNTASEKGVAQLQSADFAAYEIRKAISDLGEFAKLDEYRKSFAALTKIKSFAPGQYTERDLITLCQKSGITKRLGKP